MEHIRFFHGAIQFIVWCSAVNTVYVVNIDYKQRCLLACFQFPDTPGKPVLECQTILYFAAVSIN